MAIIKSENWDGVIAPAIPAGWTVDPQLYTATTNSPTSAPNSLIDPALNGNPAPIPHATWATPDTNGGNVQVSATVRFANATASAEQDVWVFARASVVAASANWTTLSYYYAALSRASGAPALLLNRRVGGTSTTLGTVAVPALADATDYRLSLLCSGSQIQATCQRLADGLWLNSSGVFVSDPSNHTVAVSVTDTAIAAAAGYSGVAFYLVDTAGGDVGIDDWLLETPPQASLSASPARLQAGSAAQTVTLTGVGTNFSTTSTTQFTLAGGTGAAIVAQSASSATAATLQIVPGVASGTLTITDTTDGSVTTTVAVQGTYYVSPTGSDANTGLDSAHAWQTIAKVNATTLHAGDQVLFEGGASFSGNLVIQNSGTPSAPIVIGSYGTGAATISPGTGTGIQVKDADYVRVRTLAVTGPGVTVSGSTSSTTSTSSGVEVVSTQTQASVSTWRQSVYLDGLTVSGCYTGIDYHCYGGSSTGPYPVGYNDARITNCTVHDCLNNGIHLWANSATSGNYHGLENANGTTPYHKNAYIGSCNVYNIYGDSGYTGFFTGNGIKHLSIAGGITERCRVSNCGQATNQAAGGGPGGNWLYGCQHYVIQFCETSFQHDPKGGDGIGFDIDGGCTNCTVQYCYSHDNDGTAFICDAGGGSGPTDNNTFRYNIAQNDGRLIAATAVHFFGGPTNTRVYNNTFCATTPGAGPLLGALDGASNAFYNNIFWCGPGVSLMAGVSAVTFAGNLYWFAGGPFSVVYGGIAYSSLEAFRAVQETLAGQATGLVADPQLAAPGSGGAQLPAQPVAALRAYALGAGSPAVDAGLDLRTLLGIDPGPIDVNGLPNRAGAGYDIGACEYGASALLGASAGLRRVSLSGGMGG